MEIRLYIFLKNRIIRRFEANAHGISIVKFQEKKHMWDLLWE
jgi:hypothetical protein